MLRDSIPSLTLEAGPSRAATEDDMQIIGLDPGAKFTGMAILDCDTSEFALWLESDDPTVIWHVLAEYYRKGDHIVLEAMLGGGRRDEWIQRTIEVLGYLKYRAKEAGYSVEEAPNQMRLANVSKVPKFIRGKDAVSAAAHALSHKERYGL